MSKEKRTNLEEELIPITLRIRQSHLKYLKKLSHRMSLEQDEDLTYIDLIRKAIEKEYPIQNLAK